MTVRVIHETVTEDHARVTEINVPRDKHPQLGLCPHCGIPGMTRPYMVQQTHDWGDGEPEDYYIVHCDECSGRGGECATMKWAAAMWNDVSLSYMPEQRTRWPGSKLCNVRGTSGFERHLANMETIPFWKELIKRESLEAQYDILVKRGTFTDREIAIHLARFAEARMFNAADRRISELEAQRMERTN